MIALLEQLCDIARAAGDEILQVYKQDHIKYEKKSDASPVTVADIRAHQLIVAELEKLTPDIPVVSEEAELPSYLERQQWQQFWLVDPLDGTKEFLSRTDEFTVNIALIENEQPILGVVYVPIWDKLYYAAQGQGAFVVEKNSAATQISTRKYPDKLNIVASRRHVGGYTQQFLQNLPLPYDLQSAGSSLKFCLLAEGLADMYPRFVPTCEWDTAAAHCILKEAGGVIQCLDGTELSYNKEELLNPFFLALAQPTQQWLACLPVIN